MGRMWTEDQLHAIEARGGSVLVSAAAGSGKTAVLVERLIRRITDRENPVDADRFLVVTFTKAAAAEMRERVAARLRELLRENPADGFLQHQMLLLERAQICTIDSFFGSVVRENFEQLGVSPSLRVADETLLGRLRDEVLEDLLEQQYGLKEENFIRLVRYFGEENDNRLKAEMLKLYDKIRSLPFPFQWMEEQLIRYQSVAPVEETAWGRQLMQKVSQGVNYCQQVAKRALFVLEADEGLLSAYAPACLSDLGQLEKLSGACEAGQWDGIYEALKEFSFTKLSRAPKDSDPTVKERFNALRDMVKEEVKGFRKLLPCGNADYLADLQAQAPLVEALFDLTKKFYQALDAEKQELNIGDFNDFAYLTLQLVSDEDGNPTSFAEEFSAQFEEILLDEYQDTNRLQDLIFRCISRNGENLFLVGDLKQSIYRFRNADPAVFMEKKEAFSPYDGVHYPAFISLSKNFRSREGVTSGVNAVFEKLMTRELGNVTYNEQERLNCGAIYPDVPGLPPETALQLIHVNKEETDEHRLVIEARETARQIGKMLRDGMPVTENGVLRPCRGGDFVILLRSARDTDAIFAAALKEEGVDAVLGASSGYFTSREVSVMVSLLKVLDNPMLDIPMAAVLLSPTFSFSCDELGALFVYHPGKSLYASLLLEADRGRRKARDFIRTFHLLREKSAVMNLQKLIQYIYDTTDFIEVMSSFAGPSEREANLKLLLKYALDFEAGGSGELSGFVSYIDYLMENGKDFEVANPVNEAAQSVRIMTIHKSKGLEFPVVIVANCSKKHNVMDLNGDVVMDTELGLGLKFIDRDKLLRYDTMPYLAVKNYEQQNLLSEEMRLLYVAMTRAKEKLILNVTEEALDKKLRKTETDLDGEGNIHPYAAAKALSYSDWLLAAFLPHPALRGIREKYGISVAEQENCPIELLSPVEREELEVALDEISVKPDPEMLEKLRERIYYSYPHRLDTVIPAKLSVTEITHPDSENVRLSAPQFLSEQGFTPAQKGSIFHRVLQFIDFEAGRQNAQGELDRLTERRYLTPTERDAVDVQKLRTFLESPLMDRILKADRVLREYKFFDSVAADEAGYEGSSQILIQGIADCVLDENGKGVIIDFKTDVVSDPAVLVERYAGQLSLYRRALRRVFPKGIQECIIYSVHLERQIIVKSVK